MRCNWSPDKLAFLDFETQSEAELTTATVYASHPSTRALCAVLDVDGELHRFGPYLDEGAKRRLSELTEGRTIAAHNAPFDEAVWRIAEELPEREWLDTLPKCRAAGLPGGLDEASKVLFGEGKDSNGKLLIRMLCTLKRGQKPPAIGPAHALLIEYCAQDVRVLRRLHAAVAPFGEPDVMTVDNAINSRGVPVDAQYMVQLGELYDANEAKCTAEFAGMTGGANPRSPKQVRAWLQSVGFDLPKVDKFTYKQFSAEPDQYFVGDTDMDAAFEIARAALDVRREVARVGSAKVGAALACLDADGRARDQFVYWGAHPGRWSGRELQMHNMPQSVKGIDSKRVPLEQGAMEAAQEAASADAGRRVPMADVLNSMLRGSVRSENFLVADYNAVEARCVAWISGCDRMLELFRDPARSVYVDMGKQVFGRSIDKKKDLQEYILSKTLVLGCGYGMSGAKFEWTCKSRGISTDTFSRMGLKVADAVKLYRSTYPEIPAAWRALHEAVHSAVKGSPRRACRCEFYMDGADLAAQLPSGRCIRYRNARVEALVPGYCKLYGMPEVAVPTVVFDLPRGRRGFLYGSKVCENVCQGICRDVLAGAMVALESEGLPIALHVHDEVGVEADGSELEKFMLVVSAPPAWAPGFPVVAEGYSGPVWTKNAKGYEELTALDGRVLR